MPAIMVNFFGYFYLAFANPVVMTACNTVGYCREHSSSYWYREV